MVEFLTINCNAQFKVLILIIAQYKSINYYSLKIIMTMITKILKRRRYSMEKKMVKVSVLVLF